MKHLYFCRHGLSQLGKAGLWAGSTDSPLAAEGRDEARLAGHAAKDLQIDYIISSPLSRAQETATIIAGKIGFPEKNIEINPLVVERDFGSLEGTPWDPNFDVAGSPGVESTENILERARLTLEHLKTLKAHNILIVSHGSFGRALRHILHPEIPFDTQNRFANATIIQLI